MQLLQARPKGASRRDFYLKVALGLLAVVLLAAFLTLDSVRLKYHVWKQQRALVQAKGFLEKRDAKNAQLAIEVALTAVPGSPDAMRVASVVVGAMVFGLVGYRINQRRRSEVAPVLAG